MRKELTIPLSLWNRVYPVLQAYTLLVSEHLQVLSAWHRSLVRLCQVLVNVILNLAQQGFCKPVESDDETAGGTQTSEGTGMGAGKGEKNVSNEITGEEQVEGLQDEQEEEASSQQGDDRDKEEDKVDMTDDFEGRTEDVPEKEDDEQEDKEGDDKDEAQDEVGQVDPLDPSAVDDKFWQGDEKEDEPQEQTDEQTKQQPADGKDSEMAARDEEPNRKSKPEEGEGAEAGDEPDEPEKEENQKEEEFGDAQPDMDDAGDVDEEGQRNELPQIDEEAEALQLPNDLQLDAPPKDDNGDESGMDEDIDMDGNDPQGSFGLLCFYRNADDTVCP